MRFLFPFATLAAAALLVPGVALAAPDFRVDGITAHCYLGAIPRVVVAVSNNGDHAGGTYVDVFVDRPSPPSIGEVGDAYVYTGTLYPGEQRFYTIQLNDAPARGTWVDVILDTDELWAEAVEWDNTDFIWADYTGCSLH